MDSKHIEAQFRLDYDKLKKVVAEKGLDFNLVDYKSKRFKNLPDILPTPFEVKDEYPFAPTYGTNLNTDYVIYNANEILRHSGFMTYQVFRYLFMIGRNLMPGRNYIRIHHQNFKSMLGIHCKDTYFGTFSKLVNNFNLLYHTNIRGLFIINHNILFKGDLNEFSRCYKETYTEEDSVPIEKRLVRSVVDAIDANKYRYAKSRFHVVNGVKVFNPDYKHIIQKRKTRPLNERIRFKIATAEPVILKGDIKFTDNNLIEKRLNKPFQFKKNSNELIENNEIIQNKTEDFTEPTMYEKIISETNTYNGDYDDYYYEEDYDEDYEEDYEEVDTTDGKIKV